MKYIMFIIIVGFICVYLKTHDFKDVKLPINLPEFRYHVGLIKN